MLLVVVAVEVELGVGAGGELLHGHTDRVLAHVPVPRQAVDEGQQQAEVGRPHATRGVQHEDDVCFGAARWGRIDRWID